MDASNEQVLTAVLKLRDEMSGGMKKATDATAAFEKSTATLKKALGVLGIALAGLGITRFIESIINTADQLDKMSKQTGVSVSSLQKIGASAKAAGADLQDVVVGLRTLSRHAQDAAQGGNEAKAMFKGLGIAIRDGNGNLKTAEALFGDLADVIKGVESPTLRMAIAQQMLGRSGMQLIPVLEQGRDGLYAVGDAAEQMGGIMSNQAVKALDEFGDQLTATKDIFKAMVGNWLADTEITVPKIIDQFGNLVKGVQRVMGGWKIIFNSAWETVKFLGVAVGAIFDAIAQTVAVGLAKSMKPIVEFAKILLQWFGEYLPETMRNTLSGMVSFVDTLGNKGIADPMKEALNKVDKGWETLGTNVDKYNQEIAKSTEEKIGATIEKLDELKAAIGSPVRKASGTPGARKPGTASAAPGTPQSASQALDSLLNGAHPGSPHMTDDMLEMNMARAKNEAKTSEFTRSTGIQLTTEQLDDLARASKESESAFTELLATIKKTTEADPFVGAQLALKDLVDESYNFRDAWGGIFKDMKAGFSDMFANAIEGTDSFSGGFKKAMKTLKHDLIKMFTDFAVNSLFQGAGSGLMAMFGGGAGNSPATAANAALGASGGGSAASNGVASLTGSAVNMQAIGGALGLSSGTMGAVAGLGAAGLALGIGGVKAGNRTQSTAGGALTGAALGTMVMPGIGTAVGAVVGAIAGFVMGSSARRKRLRKARAAAAAALAAYNAALAQARVVLKADIRNKYGGGLATEDAASDYGRLLSGDLSAEEINQFGSPEAIAASAGAVNKQTNVNAPITVNATVGGNYDVQRLAEELAYHLQNQMGGAAGGL